MRKIASGAGLVLASRQGERNAIIAPGRHGAPDGNSVVADVIPYKFTIPQEKIIL